MGVPVGSSWVAIVAFVQRRVARPILRVFRSSGLPAHNAARSIQFGSSVRFVAGAQRSQQYQVRSVGCSQATAFFVGRSQQPLVLRATGSLANGGLFGSVEGA
jgi:hypothetical protein